jgi:peptide methionine sulfoxide reductase MsrB
VQHLKGGKETQHRDERCGWPAGTVEIGEDEVRDVREGRNESGGEIRVNGCRNHGFDAER